MQTTPALPGSARTWLTHAFGCGLEGDNRFVVERYKAMLNGDLQAIPPEPPEGKGRRKAKPPVVSRKEVEAMRPARTEIIVCTGLRTRGGWQIWGVCATSLFHDRRQRG